MVPVTLQACPDAGGGGIGTADASRDCGRDPLLDQVQGDVVDRSHGPAVQDVPGSYFGGESER